MTTEGLKTNGFNKKKVVGALKEWDTAQGEFDKIVEEAAAEFAEAKDNILGRMEEIGIKRSVMKAIVTEQKLLAKAAGIRNRFAEDADVQDQFDNVKVAAGLPLWDYATGEAADVPQPKDDDGQGSAVATEPAGGGPPS